MNNNVKLKINDVNISAQSGSTILEVANQNEIYIPTLCYLKDINKIGACRICLVEVSGARNLVTACTTPVSEGMNVYTDSEKVIKARKNNLDLIMSTHNKDCDNCIRSGNCELQKLFNDYETKYVKYNKDIEKDESTNYLVRDNSKCILCRKCTAVCKYNQQVGVIGPNERGINTHIGCAFEKKLGDVPCVACGQCIINCPTGAITEKDDIDIVVDAINNKNLHVVVATAPSIRVALGEEFGNPIGTMVKGKMVSALKKLGFDKVFDIDFGADLTIMEEAHEFVNRFKKDENLPMFTSCSPGWTTYVEHYYPEMINNLSTCKSPQQMFGSIIKTYYAEKNNIDPKDIFVVTIMPCTAKKYEKTRDNQDASGYPDIDAVLTTRELARLIKKYNIDFNKLEDEQFDNPFGYGASVIFGASGGVMESTLRTASEIILNKPLEKIDFNEVRGIKGIKEASIELDGKTINIAVISGLSNAKKILDEIKSGKKNYHFIEIMACPGGCINGGGQPIQPSHIKNTVNVVEKRMKAIYEEDKNLPIRKSQDNPYIKEIYSNFLNTPGSPISHKVLHTKYKKKEKYN